MHIQSLTFKTRGGMILNLEEERRLMYVAMTRAMERLIITYRKRQMGQPIRVASRFLGELVGAKGK